MPLSFLSERTRWLAAIVLLCAALFGPAFFAHAAWDGQLYAPGETLDPECLPTDLNCDVDPTVDAAHGGTGLTSYDEGDLLYADSASSLGRLSLGVDGKVLKIVGGALAWADDEAGTPFSADGAGIELSGSVFSIELDGASLSKSADGLRLSTAYSGQDSITTLGTITTGTWRGSAIEDAYLDKSGDWEGTLENYSRNDLLDRANHSGLQDASTISDFDTAVAGLLSTGNGLVVNGTAFGLVLDGSSLSKSIDGLRLSATYAGQNTITTLGTVATGVWNGTAIGDAYLTKSGNWTGTFDGIEGAAYAILAGQSGGQTLIGGTAANNALVLKANSATSGNTLTTSGITFLVGDSAATTALAISHNGNVGIGATNSTAKLNISGDGGSAGVLFRIQDTSATVGYATTGVLQTYQGNIVLQAVTSGKNIGFWDSSAERLTVKSGGTVGIGNTSPTHKLDLTAGSLTTTQRALSVTGTLSSTVARQVGAGFSFATSAGNTNENDGLLVQLTAGNVSSAYNIAGMFGNTVAGIGTSVIGGTANYALYGDSTSLTVGTNIGSYGQSASGLINIGVSGSAITAKDSGFNIGVLGLGRNTGTSGVQLGGFFGLNSTAPTFASAGLMADNSSTTSPIFVARDNGTEVFRIDDGGKVGIGSASPQQLVDVSSTQPILRVTNTTNMGGVAWAAAEIAKIEFYSADASQPSVSANISVIGSADSAGGVAAGDLAFFTKNTAGSLTEKVRITDLGGVGIGTSAPGSYGLRLTATRQAASGDLAVASFENAGTSSADVLTLKQTGEAGSSESAFINFYTNLGLVGTITSNGSGVTSYNTTSDRRLKDNIEETEYGIDDVLKIPVREYTMRQDPRRIKQTGFIAQELAAIYPDAVSANGDDGLGPLNGKTPWSIDYGRLTPLLVKSIQDQQILLGDIADKDALASVTGDAQREIPNNAFDYITAKIRNDWRPLLNFAALRVTAIRGYFDEVFARRSHQEELCVGTPGNETCLTKSQLDALLSRPAGGSSPAPAAPPMETPPVETPTESTPPPADPIPESSAVSPEAPPSESSSAQ